MAGFALVWVALIAVLWWQQRRSGGDIDRRAVLRLAPDVIRLVRRLAVDPAVPRATRWWLIGLLAYLLSPIDLVPDFLPMIGYADDAVVVAIALGFAIRHAGMPAIERHWPGTPEGLSSVFPARRCGEGLRVSRRPPTAPPCASAGRWRLPGGVSPVENCLLSLEKPGQHDCPSAGVQSDRCVVARRGEELVERGATFEGAGR